MGAKQERAYDALVTTIHSVVLEPGRWDALLRRIADAVDARSGGYYLRDKSSGRPTLCHLVGQGEALWWHCVERRAGVDPWTSAAHQSVVGTWVSQPHFFDDRCLGHHGDVVARVDRHTVAACVFDDGRTDALVGFQRDRDQPPFSAIEVDLLSRLSPHLELTCRLTSEFSRLRLQAAVARQALDRLATPIWVVDAGGTVLFANHAADRGLPGISVKHGKMHAEATPVSTRLASLLLQASGGKPRTGALALDADDGSRLNVLISPLPPDSPLAADWHQPMVLMMAHNPSTSDAQLLEVLTALYGLSPAECRLAALLLEGCTPAEAADRLLVQVSTVRTQLKSMFWKTGTGRQGALIKLLSGALLIKT
jgi:DNA-binding CsgD family transcriptional regulator/PAS domain-containing protein